MTQEYSLESDILDLVDTNIGENVELYEIEEDIKNNLNEYIECLRDYIYDIYIYLLISVKSYRKNIFVNF
mgnify:FL=1